MYSVIKAILAWTVSRGSEVKISLYLGINKYAQTGRKTITNVWTGACYKTQWVAFKCTSLHSALNYKLNLLPLVPGCQAIIKYGLEAITKPCWTFWMCHLKCLLHIAQKTFAGVIPNSRVHLVFFLAWAKVESLCMLVCPWAGPLWGTEVIDFHSFWIIIHFHSPMSVSVSFTDTQLIEQFKDFSSLCDILLLL